MASCLSVIKNDFLLDRNYIHPFFLIITGPPEQAMWALGNHQVSMCILWHFSFDFIGDKIASSIIAQSVDVPTLTWSGSRKYKTFTI